MNTYLPDHAASLPIPTAYYCPNCGNETHGNGGVEYHCVRCNSVLIEVSGGLDISQVVDLYVRALPILRQSLLCLRCGRPQHGHEPTKRCLTFHPALFGRRAV
jgi:hypothetical protein